KKAKPHRKGRAYWIERDGAVWLIRRAGRGMLAGMRALPDDGWCAGSDGSAHPPVAGDWQNMGAVQHDFTHFRLSLELMVHDGSVDAVPQGEGEWWPLASLEGAGLPTLFAKAARLAVAQEQDA
ncbi:MAG: NUDIX domain-containing protein, partial [Novosphingobium sp.]|nr:NUDIX domain-containing protein [Novosphingobium sp.]